MKRSMTHLKLSAMALAAGIFLAGSAVSGHSQEVDIFYDEYGRRIILDAYTGELIRIDPPRAVRRRPVEPRVYLDEERPVIERRRERQARRAPSRASRELPNVRFPNAPILEFPDAPPTPQRRRAPVERAPIEEPEQLAAPEPAPEQLAAPEPEPRPRIEPEQLAAPEPLSEPEQLAEPELRVEPEQLAEPEPQLEEPEQLATQEPLEEPEQLAAPQPPVETEPLPELEQLAEPEQAPLAEPQQTASAPALARPEPNAVQTTASQEELAALQVLLDRAGASPGVIDGRMGENVANAVDAYSAITGRDLDFEDSAAVHGLLEETGGPAFIPYTITGADMDGPFVAAIPVDYSEKAELGHLSYTSPAEKLAERFHMDEDYLKALNPGVDFAPGAEIIVAGVGRNVDRFVASIVADKTKEQVRAYDASGALVAAYPSTIGSTETPSPSGTVEVERIAFDPNYTYNPKVNFKQGENNEVLTIPPGPNGPVGSIWIALSKPTYGIHGTPEPSTIGKTNSYGCVRLTNWDAQELAKLVKQGVPVEFVE